MKRVINASDAIFCMSNMLGKKIHVPHTLPFSFYFSGCDTTQHDIRVKPIFSPEKMRISKAGTLKLCDDWEYIPGEDDVNVSAKDIKRMKRFFRTYLVLFCAVWDDQLDDSAVQAYLEGEISLDELIKDLDFYPDWGPELDQIRTIDQLEDFCVDNNLIDIRDN